MITTARFFFWLSIAAAVIVAAIWGIGGLALAVLGWAFGAFTVMAAKMAADEEVKPS